MTFSVAPVLFARQIPGFHGANGFIARTLHVQSGTDEESFFRDTDQCRLVMTVLVDSGVFDEPRWYWLAPERSGECRIVVVSDAKVGYFEWPCTAITFGYFSERETFL